MSPSPLNFLPEAAGQAQQQIIYGQVSPNQPLPTDFADPLYVIQTDWTTGIYFTIEPGRWKAEHGATLPAALADCLLIKDPRDNLWCVSWSGIYS